MGNLCGCGKKDDTISAGKQSPSDISDNPSIDSQNESLSSSGSDRSDESIGDTVGQSLTETTTKKIISECETFTDSLRESTYTRTEASHTTEIVAKYVSILNASEQYFHSPNEDNAPQTESAFDSSLLKNGTESEYSSRLAEELHPFEESVAKNVSETTEQMLARNSGTSYECASEIKSYPQFCLKEQVFSKNSSPKDSLRSSVGSYSSSSSQSPSTDDNTEVEYQPKSKTNEDRSVDKSKPTVVAIDGQEFNVIAEFEYQPKSKNSEDNRGDNTCEAYSSSVLARSDAKPEIVVNLDLIDKLTNGMSGLQLDSMPQNNNRSDYSIDGELKCNNDSEREQQSTATSHFKYHSSSILAPIPEETGDEPNIEADTAIKDDKSKNSANASPISMTSTAYSYPASVGLTPSPGEYNSTVYARPVSLSDGEYVDTISPVYDSSIELTTSDSSSSSSPPSYRVFK